MSEIIFLHHESSNDDEARRQIRSRAAQHSHRVGPRKPKARNLSSKRADKSKVLESESSQSRRGSSISLATSATSTTSASVDLATKEDGEQPGGSSKPLQRVAKGRRPAISRLGSFADEPFESYPVPSQIWFGAALDYMWPFMRRGWSFLPATSAQSDEAMQWVQRLTMNEPAYFYMNMLSVMGDLVSRQQKDPQLLVWLTGQVVACVNEALSDPVKSLAIGTILTVGRLALREIILGDMNAGVTYHRPAFARMIVMAGGIEALKLPPLVREHLAWADRMMTKKTGIKISQIEPSLADEPTFDGGGTDENGHNDTKVLDTYRPYRPRKPGSPVAGGDESNEGKTQNG